MIPTEQARPSTASEHDGIGGDPPRLGHDGADAARSLLETAHGTACEYGSAEMAGAVGNRGCRLLRLGTTRARRVDAAEPPAGGAGQQLCHLLARQHAGVNLIDTGLLEPGLVVGELGLGAAKIYDALGTKARLTLHLSIESPPDPVCLEAQLDLARIAALRAAPSPIAARLLGADGSLLAEHDVDAFVGQRQCRAAADDAASDHHYRRAIGKPSIAVHRIGTGRCRNPRMNGAGVG